MGNVVGYLRADLEKLRGGVQPDLGAEVRRPLPGQMLTLGDILVQIDDVAVAGQDRNRPGAARRSESGNVHSRVPPLAGRLPAHEVFSTV